MLKRGSSWYISLARIGTCPWAYLSIHHAYTTNFGTHIGTLHISMCSCQIDMSATHALTQVHGVSSARPHSLHDHMTRSQAGERDPASTLSIHQALCRNGLASRTDNEHRGTERAVQSGYGSEGRASVIDGCRWERLPPQPSLRQSSSSLSVLSFRTHAHQFPNTHQECVPDFGVARHVESPRGRPSSHVTHDTAYQDMLSHVTSPHDTSTRVAPSREVRTRDLSSQIDRSSIDPSHTNAPHLIPAHDTPDDHPTLHESDVEQDKTNFKSSGDTSPPPPAEYDDTQALILRLHTLLDEVLKVLRSYTSTLNPSTRRVQVLYAFYDRVYDLLHPPSPDLYSSKPLTSTSAMVQAGSSSTIAKRKGDGKRGLTACDVDILEREWWDSEVVAAWYGPSPKPHPHPISQAQAQDKAGHGPRTGTGTGIGTGTGKVGGQRRAPGLERIASRRAEGAYIGMSVDRKDREQAIKRDASFVGLYDE